MSGQLLRAGSKHSYKNLVIVKEDLIKGTINFEAAKEKEVRQLEELDQAQATVKGLLAEYQNQLVKVEQAKAAYQEAQTAMFDLMDESKKQKGADQ